MKTKLAIVFFLLLVFSRCMEKNNVLEGDSMKTINYHKPFISLNALTVYQIGDTYIGVIKDNGVVQKKVEFSSDRRSISVYRINLAKIEEINSYLGKTLGDLKENLGEIHVDIGSGFYIPAYITTNGFLIYFHLEDDTIIGVGKHDLLSNSLIEQYPE